MTETNSLGLCSCCGVREADDTINGYALPLYGGDDSLRGLPFSRECSGASTAEIGAMISRIRARRASAATQETDETWLARQLTEYTGYPAHVIGISPYSIIVALHSGVSDLRFAATLERVTARDAEWVRAELAKCDRWPRVGKARFYGTEPSVLPAMLPAGTVAHSGGRVWRCENVAQLNQAGFYFAAWGPDGERAHVSSVCSPKFIEWATTPVQEVKAPRLLQQPYDGSGREEILSRDGSIPIEEAKPASECECAGVNLVRGACGKCGRVAIPLPEIESVPYGSTLVYGSGGKAIGRTMGNYNIEIGDFGIPAAVPREMEKLREQIMAELHKGLLACPTFTIDPDSDLLKTKTLKGTVSIAMPEMIEISIGFTREPTCRECSRAERPVLATHGELCAYCAKRGHGDTGGTSFDRAIRNAEARERLTAFDKRNVPRKTATIRELAKWHPWSNGESGAGWED